MKFRGRGATKTPEMDWRKRATQATMDRYRDKPFSWQEGITCVHMARFHLRNMGHRPQSLPRFRSAFMAKQALKERGWPDVSAMLDSMLPQIPPAMMLLGDLVVIKGDGALDGIGVCSGQQKVFGWSENADGLIELRVSLDKVVGVWRA